MFPLRSLLQRAPESLVTLTEYIERFRLLELLESVFLNEYFVDASKEGGTCDILGLIFTLTTLCYPTDPWLRILMTVQHFAICKDDTCPWVGSGAYNDLVRHMLEHGGLWRRTIVKLVELCSKEKSGIPALYNATRKRIQVWISSGISIGLKGSRQFSPLTESEGCHRKGCIYSQQSGDTSHRTLRRCSACQRVSYCSKDCQAKDWKAGHRHACKTIGEK
jgi:hypothetical protein